MTDLGKKSPLIFPLSLSYMEKLHHSRKYFEGTDGSLTPVSKKKQLSLQSKVTEEEVSKAGG